MSQNKTPIELGCPTCQARFRLWIPEELLPSWERGQDISCINCGARLTVKKGGMGFEVSYAAAPAPPETSKETEEPLPEGAKTVLYIEDDTLARNMMQDALTGIGLNFATAGNSVEAINFLSANQVDLIVTDLYLKNPGDPDGSVDGEELLQNIIDLGYSIPTIITTGKEIIDDIALNPKWFDMHVKGFIQKGNPFWTDDLKLKIKETLQID